MFGEGGCLHDYSPSSAIRAPRHHITRRRLRPDRYFCAAEGAPVLPRFQERRYDRMLEGAVNVMIALKPDLRGFDYLRHYARQLLPATTPSPLLLRLFHIFFIYTLFTCCARFALRCRCCCFIDAPLFSIFLPHRACYAFSCIERVARFAPLLR